MQLTSSFLVLSAAVWMYSNRNKQNDAALPVLALVVGTYWWFFGLELFWGEREIQSVYADSLPIANESITATMVALVVGVGALLFGVKSRIGPSPRWAQKWDLVDDPNRWTWLRIVLCLGTLLMVSGTALDFLGDGVRQMVVLFQTMLPSVAFAVLFRNYLRGRASSFDKLLLIAFCALRFVGGMASGWLGSAASMALVCGAVYLSERKRVPYWAPGILVLYVLFFQVGKNEYRLRYWSDEQTDVSPVTRLSYWFDSSLSEWQKAISAGDKQAYVDLVSQSLMRTSLLTQVANVIENTPQEVPFQKGRTYSYFLVTWIPRFLWPDKPSVNTANQFYQVAYGLTEEDSLDHVSIAVGSLGEAYMNFGWIGVPFVMFFIGIVLGIYQRIFLSANSGQFLFAVGVSLIPQLLTIESQLAQYFSGMLQQILFCVLVFSPLLRRRGASSFVPSSNRHDSIAIIRDTRPLPSAG